MARATAAAVKWNRGLFACAVAIIAGRAGHASRATSLADQGHALLAPFAPLWTHLARRLMSEPAQADGWGHPADWLRESASELDASGHQQLAAACRRTLRRAGEVVPRPRRADRLVPPALRELGVTNREMDVYQPLAEGMADSEIADRLCISRKTVETDTASLRAKTGRASRRELVAHGASNVPARHPPKTGMRRPHDTTQTAHFDGS
jgi:DNA-binding CsgD family transcriptional regulator